MAIYAKINKTGEELFTIPGVLAAVALTGVETTSGSNLITVASTVGVYPGMALKGPSIPLGAFVHCVRSATVLELYATVWTVATGVGSTSAANANASATLSAQLAYALGFDANTPVALWYLQGKWRNEHSTSGTGIVPSNWLVTCTEPQSSIARLGYGLGMAVLPTTGITATGAFVPSAFEMIKSDRLASTPLKRDNGEGWTHYILVSTGGMQSRVSLDPREHDIIYTGAD